MKKTTISKLLQTIVIVTFVLPFFYTGCENSKKNASNKVRTDSLIKDSIARLKQANIDSLEGNVNITKDSVVEENVLISVSPTSISDTKTKDTSENEIAAVTSDSNQKTKSDDKEMLSDELANDYPILAVFLKPSEDTYSGLGSILNVFNLIIFFSLFISFILLITGLVIKFIEPTALWSIVILDILIFAGIFIARSPSWNSEKLWGFWVCLISASALVLFDCYILIKNRR